MRSGERLSAELLARFEREAALTPVKIWAASVRLTSGCHPGQPGYARRKAISADWRTRAWRDGFLLSKRGTLSRSDLAGLVLRAHDVEMKNTMVGRAAIAGAAA